ncbi:hypothetical protein [Nocardia sp. NPDC005825]|uniref:hypothetical protein n=1 Tax=unclassified Nocardia TaxID=2637762 RepID=UPI003411A810
MLHIVACLERREAVAAVLVEVVAAASARVVDRVLQRGLDVVVELLHHVSPDLQRRPAAAPRMSQCRNHLLQLGFDRALRLRGRCPGCGDDWALPGLAPDSRDPICTDCAGRYTDAASRADRAQIRAAICFLEWMRSVGLDIDALNRQTIDTYLSANPTKRQPLSVFLRWLRGRSAGSEFEIVSRRAGGPHEFQEPAEQHGKLRPLPDRRPPALGSACRRSAGEKRCWGANSSQLDRWVSELQRAAE